MKTKQGKEELEKSTDEDTSIEPKTRARKKASDEEDKNKASQDDPKPSKEPKKNVAKPKAIIKKRPLGIRKALRSKKAVVNKEAVKAVIKQTVRRGRKPVAKPQPENSQDKETVPLIPASEIKKEPIDDTTPNSRSSSPRTAGRRPRLSSDMIMMKSVLADSPSSLVLGPRTSPYSMRSERSNSPSMFEGKNLRSGKPRKAKANLLNEVVIKEQNKRRRLLSDSKAPETESLEDSKKLKRGRSCSRDGSEISKCSDITESDLSLSESLNDTDSKELNKKLDKAKTDLDIDIENNVQISTTEKVPSLNDDSKLAETKLDTDSSCITNQKNKKSLSLKRSTSLDSDNNNSNRLKLDNLNSSDVGEKSMIKTENDTLFEARNSILNSMSKTFNSKEISKNIRKGRRVKKNVKSRTNSTPGVKNGVNATSTDASEDKQETLESLSKEIDDLINNLDQNIDRDCEMTNESVAENTNDQLQTKSASKFYGTSKALSESNSINPPETPVKDKDGISITNENTPSKIDDSENIRLHYEEDSTEKSSDSPKQEITYKCSTVASIDKLMDRLKEFEEFDKRRQRQESETKPGDGKSLMVTNDVVLIPKSGADIKPLKDIQTVRSPERPMEKENVLSCFENNSAISIVKRDQVRKSIDVDLPNSVTLIKRNSISSRKESTSSNHSKETDAISIFEKSLGKDVTLTEIRKSVDKTPSTQVDLHQFATLHPTNQSQNVVVLDTNQISILPRAASDIHATKRSSRSSRESISRKSSESGNDDVMATIEKIKSPQHQVKSSEISITPTVAIKSHEVTQPMEAEPLPAALDNVKNIPEEITLISKAKPEITESTEIAKVESSKVAETSETPKENDTEVDVPKSPKPEEIKPKDVEKVDDAEKPEEKVEVTDSEKPKSKAKEETKVEKSEKPAKTVKGEKSKSARNSIESLPGPSNALHETPESQKRKENVLRTLGLLTHKAAKEAKIEKLKEKERIYGGLMSNKSKAVKAGSGDYTGTLKTVIKLNRGTGDRDKKKYRSSLKMTFQKSKNRGKPQPEEGQDANEDEAYYTIERKEANASAPSDDGEAVPEPVEPKETLNLVIPEKASSFSIHPGRLCMDQCFYCGGKFGLFDTPCHIAQMKSAERQKKVLDNEEKLTIDSCLCDACYRHVDRRANCPSYRKRPAKLPSPLLTPPVDTSTEKPPISPPEDEESEEEPEAAATGRPAICHTAGCGKLADHSIRRKWLIKMRASVNKLLKLEGDYPGLHTIPLCADHHRALAPLMACVLCRRRITKHHNVHLLHSYTELNPLLKAVGIPVVFTERPVLCKLCRYYCTLLQRPTHNQGHATQYRRKLLQIYNIEVPPETEQETQDTNIQEDLNSSKTKKKTRTKSKQRKSADPEKPDSECSEKTESSPEKDKSQDEIKAHHLEEDIESLISSNKIPVPGAKMNEVNAPSDNSESEVTIDYDMPLIPVDKQTELQYLLQKQNNPAQFLNKVPNLTNKQKHMKLQNLIQKPGQQHRISDKNAKRIQKIGQTIANKEKSNDDVEVFDADRPMEGVTVFKNISLSDECTIESIPNKKPADINTLKNKWQMSESFTQVKKNLSELSKKLTVEKDPKKSSVKYLNPVKRLETNPSISVRELFPGEEEMNLQCSVEFNNVKSITPEGWEKCSSTIQYDLETKRLWNELQRPYGNQSSFLRHLILLEKYFRNGDLVLSHNATPNAANYSDSIQSRLRAYDNVVNDTPRRAEPAISLIEYRKKPSINGKSLLKSNQGEDKEVKKAMPPPGIIPKSKKSDKLKKQLPPELIAINTPNAQGRKAIQNVLHNIQQLVKGVSASDPTEVAAAPLPTPKIDPPKEKKDPPKEQTKDTPKKQKPTSKPWRPTLMPITPENMAKIAREPTQVAVDGRNLPSLVQVMSSGKRYHITLQDYNKMCIMRREKLQQLQDGDKNKKSEDKETTVVTEIQPSTMLGNGGTVMQNIPQEKESEKKEMPELTQISSNAANILKNVGLKNITIAPITPKTATVTSLTTHVPLVSSPSLLVTSTPIKLPQLGSSVSITSETVLTPNMPIMSTGMTMPKIPKSLTVIPQMVMNVPQNVVASMPQNVVATTVSMPQGMVVPQGIVMPQSVMPQNVHQGLVVPQSVSQGIVVPQMVPSTQTDGQRP
ncbi:uncharacterized protein LOC126373059 isoform X2 [Pectinophora gossypiella]|uniref:uncharacterized protein LOC126373059 isoform X2 n=1 Tax=Pectinophora gossypiella TaxID=13191 RepID=UPI00214E09D3|nr:uncharacterized protein LOC126373059 isoform X2 [Pectinophora gossypiella]